MSKSRARAGVARSVFHHAELFCGMSKSLAASPRFLSLAFCALALLFFSLNWLRYHPFQARLYGDPAIYAYIAQQAARGHPPHLAVYEVKASLSTLLAAPLLYAGSFTTLPEIYPLRLYMFGVTALSVGALYFLGKSFSRARIVGLLAALFLASFAGLLRTVTNGIEPKAVTMLFGLLALLALTRRAWFWAGAAGACAGLAWQIGFGYVALALLLAGAQNDSWRARARAGGMVLLGALLPVALYGFYFVAQGAARDAFQQNIVVPFFSKTHQTRSNRFFLSRLTEAFARNYSAQIFIGFCAVGGWLLAWRYALRSRRAFVLIFLKNPRTSGALLAGTGLFVYSLFDFQAYPDWIPLLPFLALFAACALAWLFLRIARRAHLAQKYRAPVLAGVIFCILGAANWPLWTAPPSLSATWRDQQRLADELNATLTADDTVWLVGKSELLFFLHRSNLTRYTTFLRGTDAVIEQLEPGGFDGFLERIRAARPMLIVLARFKRQQWTNGARFERLLDWVHTAYVPLHACKLAGDGQFFARADLAQTRFARKTEAVKKCFTRAEP